ncbi:MAG: hypothetical protein ABI847_00195 [Anaerolineales bacterium]
MRQWASALRLFPITILILWTAAPAMLGMAPRPAAGKELPSALIQFPRRLARFDTAIESSSEFESHLRPSLLPAPFAPTGRFLTPEWPRSFPGGQLVALRTGDYYYLAGSLFRAGPDLLWERLADPVEYANKTVVTFSPDFEHDHFIAAGLDYGVDSLKFSSDGGYNWASPLHPVDGVVKAIVFSPAFSFDQTMFVALRINSGTADGLLRSLNGGRDWRVMPLPPHPGPIEQLIMSPFYGSDQTVIARMSDGTLWQSPDAGAQWFRADYGLGTYQGNPARYVALAPLANGVMAYVVTTDAALVISFDVGLTWYLIDWKTFRTITVPPDFGSSLTIYGIEPVTERLFQTTNLGDSWTTPLGDEFIGSVTASGDFERDRIVYAAGVNGLWRSAGPGQPWSLLSTGSPGGRPDHISSIVTSPNFNNDGTVFALNDYSSQVSRLAVSQDAGRYWSEHEVPGPGDYVMAVFSPSFQTDHKLLATRGTSLYFSDDLGANWQPLATSLPIEPTLFAISPAYTTDHTLFIGHYGDGIWRSTNNGATWSRIFGEFVTDLDISSGYPADPVIFVTLYNDGVFRTDNAGGTWTPVSAPNFSPDYRITLSPNYPQDHTLFSAATGISSGGAFRSEDSGATWIDITGHVQTHYMQPATVSPRYAQDHTVLMAPDIGPLYWSENGGENWFALRGGNYPYVVDYYHDRPVILAKPFIYQWPTLPTAPSVVGTGLVSGTTGIVSVTLRLETSAFASSPPRWELTGGADWLGLSTVSGTLPATVTLTIDSDLIQTANSTNLTIRRYVSLRQVETTTLKVAAFWSVDDFRIPAIFKAGLGTVAAALHAPLLDEASIEVNQHSGVLEGEWWRPHPP